MDQPTFEPMSIGKLFDVASTLYRKNFLRFLAIVAIIKIPFVLLTLLYTTDVDVNNSPLLVFVTPFLTMTAQQVIQGALIIAISGTYLGREVTVGQAYKALLPRLGALIVASVAVSIVVGIGFLLLVIPGIIFGLWFALTSQALLVENRGPFNAMRRSKELASKNLGKIFAVGLIASLLAVAAFYVMHLLSAALVGDSAGMTAVVIRSAIQAVGEILILPITAGAFVLLYYDLRIRKEGFDLEMMAQSLEQDGSTQSTPLQPEPVVVEPGEPAPPEDDEMRMQ